MTKSLLIKKFNLAVELEKRGDYPTALNEYQSIIMEDKSYRQAYVNLGALYSRMNRFRDAMKIYLEALSLGEDYITHFNIGCIFYKMGDYKKAVLSLERSKKMNANFALSILVMGLSYSRMSNIKAAETNFVNVLSIWPENRVALTALSIIYYNSLRYDQAIAALNRLISLDEGNVKIRDLKTTILYKSGRLDESAAEVKSIKKISNGYKLYDDFIKSVPVEAYTDKYGSLDEKIRVLEVKARKDKDSLISLSLCHLFKGNTDTAIDVLFEAKKRFLN